MLLDHAVRQGELMKIVILYVLIILLGLNSSAVHSDTMPAGNMYDKMLGKHNYYRKQHNAPDLKWNDEISAVAQEWADRLAKENKMYHRQPNKYGENIYWVSGGMPSGEDAVDAWYSEIEFYNFKRPGFSGKTGHFTQLVWASTTEIGCGIARSKSGGVYIVCNYSPPGNYLGQFEKNVGPKR